MAKHFALLFLLVSCHAETKIKTNMSADALPAPYVSWDVHDDAFYSRDEELRVAWKAGGFGVEKFTYLAFLSLEKACTDKRISPSYVEGTTALFTGVPEGSYYLCLHASVNDRSFPAANNGIKVTIDRSAPVFTALSLANSAADKTLSYEEILLDQELVAAVEASGHDSVVYEISPAKAECASLSYPTNQIIPKAGILASLEKGEYKVCVQLKDKAGHSVFGSSPSFTLNTDAPSTNGGLMTALNIEATGMLLNWPKARDAKTPLAKLKYALYRSVTPHFATIAEVESGTLLTSGADISSFSVTDLVESSTYFFNIIVENERGFKSLYTKLEARTKARRGSSFIEIFPGAKSHQCAVADDRKGYCWGANDAGQLGIGGSGANVDKPTPIAGDHHFLEIHTGDKHSCGLTVKGEIYCWGLANNTPTKASDDRFLHLATGLDHSCAIRSNGDLFCWGSGTQGQLGNDAGADAAQPTPTASGLKFRAIAANGSRTCGITDSGASYCWGDGAQSPTLINPTVQFREIAIGSKVTCGINDSGKVFCWGKNNSGAIGNGATDADEVAPVAIQSTETFRSLAAGAESVCGITTAGATYCWGANDKGQLGLGDTSMRSTPTWLNHGRDYVKIAATAQSFCGLTATGESFCWGSDEQEQLGNGASSGNKLLPSVMDVSQVSGDFRFIQLLAGGWTSCGLTSQGNVYCAGAYSDGSLGYGSATTAPAPLPVAVPTSQKLRTLTNGYDHQCGLNAQGKAYCWGINEWGQIGIGSSSAKEIYPRAVSLPGTFIQVVAGRNSTCGIRSDGAAYCWGSDEFGQLGDGDPKEDKNVPVPIASSLKFVSIAAGETHYCAITQEGLAHCWGHNDKRQLGDGTMVDSTSPKAVNGSRRFLSVTAGKNHSCGVAADGISYCWGSDNVGQLGNGESITGLQSDPTAVDSTEIFRSVHTGYSFTCGVSEAGKAYCWGSDSWGRLGNGATGGHGFTPGPVSSSDTFVGISTGYAHACALSASNQGVCWGHDGFEGLADGPGATDLNAPGAYITVSP